ncbi:hypothetical protein AVEN_258514-1 [Araneus ventricosus]|uniref:RNase H type-1 domain-containing protein n=1 Tax=Araneus ventricosus TaxID=182803 RepID=A0A4Y2GVR0_ARAVE|nr:hypothetical protein AVEN_258514-1 [Araneus ventricosus]
MCKALIRVGDKPELEMELPPPCLSIQGDLNDSRRDFNTGTDSGVLMAPTGLVPAPSAWGGESLEVSISRQEQAALEVINNIPIEATLIYTDGSKNEIGHTGSEVFVKHGRWEASLKRRNADYCSVFRSEMIAIDMALDFVLEHQLFGEIWILLDSRSVVQYLDNWRDVSDRRGMDIFNKLKTLRNSCVLHLQWMPSHVNLKYNDIADSLAKEGTTMPQAYVEPLTYLELYSRR